MDPTILAAIIAGAVALGIALIPYTVKRRKDAEARLRRERLCFQCGDFLAQQFALLIIESLGHSIPEADLEREPMLRTVFASLGRLNVDEATLDLVRTRLRPDAGNPGRMGKTAGTTKIMLRDILRLSVGDKAGALFALAFSLRLVELISLVDPSAMRDLFASFSEEAKCAGVATTAVRPGMTRDEFVSFTRSLREKYQ